MGAVRVTRDQLQLAMDDPAEAEFQEWVRDPANRGIVDEVARRARAWHRSGKDRCSVRMLLESIRWDTGLRAAAADGFKVNNNVAPRIARLVLAECPDLPPRFFETRRLRRPQEGHR